MEHNTLIFILLKIWVILICIEIISAIVYVILRLRYEKEYIEFIERTNKGRANDQRRSREEV